MSNTFTAQELSGLYQKVADGGELEFRVSEDWLTGLVSPSLGSVRQDWRIKPTKKVIDLSVLIDSQIDCEFKDLENDSWVIGKLHDLPADHDGDFKYWKRQDNSGCWYDKCQPRMNHIHAWQGGECPLPEGFRVKVWFRNTLYAPVDRPATSIRWCHDGDLYDIIAFEVLGLADGYVMPWEQDNG